MFSVIDTRDGSTVFVTDNEALALQAEHDNLHFSAYPAGMFTGPVNY